MKYALVLFVLLFGSGAQAASLFGAIDLDADLDALHNNSTLRS